MAHLSLYRAFRPTTFKDVVRQEHIVKILTSQIENDSVGHAYLFCGPRGTGKTSVARIFARAVNCEQPKNGSPCGTCPTCRALKEGGGLDIAEIDAASNNGVNEMRDLREKVQYPPVAGKYKVYIIDEVHMLTDSAFNALLKTLEEPPRHAIFVLATTEPQKLPATILSRCMRLDFKLIPQHNLEAHLKRVLNSIEKSYEEEAVSAIAAAGEGSVRDMLSIAEMCIAYGEKLTYEGVSAVLGTADFPSMSKVVSAILRRDAGEAIAAAEAILSEGKSVGVLLRDMLQFLNRTAIVKTCRNAETLLALPKNLYDRVEAVAKEADPNAILRTTEIFAKAETELRISSSPRICLETAIIKAATPSADYDIDALMSRVTALEGKLSGVSALPKETAAPKAVEKKVEKRAPENEPAFDDSFVPPEEFFEGAPFESEKPAPPVRREAPPPVQTVKAPVKSSAAEPVAARESSEGLPAEAVFGKFIRTLRKTSRNGVLFTMCSDLIASYGEDGTLLLETESETVFRSLKREDHHLIMADVFAAVGVEKFDVTYKKKQNEHKEEREGIETLKRDFPDYEIEFK